MADTTGERWRPLSQRTSARSDEPLIEGVSDHLTYPLINWFVRQTNPTMLQDIAIRLRVQLAPASSTAMHTGTAGSFLSSLIHQGQHDTALDAIDMALFERRSTRPTSSLPDAAEIYQCRHQVEELGKILQLGGSAWRVNDDGSALELRVDDAVRELVAEAHRSAAAHSPSASDHLREAWKATYGRHPDPSKAYSQAIKAVEAAAAPVVTPNDLMATLGKIRGEMRKGPAQWELSIADQGGTKNDASTVIELISLLWEGQTDRHGGIQPTKPITAEAAQSATHLAALLVHWFTAGLITARK